MGAALASPPRKGAGNGCGCGAGRAPATWQCKQEGQRPWHQEPGRQRSVGGGSFLPSPIALWAPATGRGVGSLGAPLPGKRHRVGPRSRATVVISLSAGCWKGRCQPPSALAGARCCIHPTGHQMVSDSSHGPPPASPAPQRCTRASPLPLKASAGGEVPQRGQCPPSPGPASLPHGCADGSSVPVLDTVWFLLGDGSWDRPVVPGARADRVKGSPQDGTGGRPAEGSRPAFLS